MSEIIDIDDELEVRWEKLDDRILEIKNELDEIGETMEKRNQLINELIEEEIKQCETKEKLVELLTNKMKGEHILHHPYIFHSFKEIQAKHNFFFITMPRRRRFGAAPGNMYTLR